MPNIVQNKLLTKMSREVAEAEEQLRQQLRTAGSSGSSGLLALDAARQRYMSDDDLEELHHADVGGGDEQDEERLSRVDPGGCRLRGGEGGGSGSVEARPLPSDRAASTTSA